MTEGKYHSWQTSAQSHRLSKQTINRTSFSYRARPNMHQTSSVALQADGVDEAERQAQQDSVNPAYVPRNHVMQDAVKLADQGDYSEVSPRLHSKPSSPVCHPHRARREVGCSLLSCCAL